MKLPIKCPSCDKSLRVSKLKCDNCSTEVSGDFPLPYFFQLTQEEQDFVLDFFLNSGNIKEMSKKAGLSYPTMRNKMDDLIEKIQKLKPQL